MKVEICVDSVEGAVAAERGGADRIELCANLAEGGTTPSFGAIQIARAAAKIDIHVLIRPRGGDFLYTDTELLVMREDILRCKELGVDGVVFGCLTADGDIDVDRTSDLLAAASGLDLTFHRAFDMCRDPIEALEQLIRLGIRRVLTSGQEISATEGVELLSKLQRQARNRIMIMAGGGITPSNVRALVTATGVTEVHLSARSTRESRMNHRNLRCRMGGVPPPSEFQRRTTDERLVRAVVSEF